MSEKLTHLEFDLLVTLISAKVFSQSEKKKELNQYTSVEIEETLRNLRQKNYIDGEKITELGINALNPYQAKRAIFLAAGIGSRMMPITINTPKPLVRINNKRILDGLIEAIFHAGINEIIVVRGYLGEQFDYLLNKYPTIKLVDNLAYDSANNIASAMCVRGKLANAYILEADLLISTPSIIKKYNYSSNFLGIKTESSNDWCLMVENEKIVEQTLGGKNCYQMVGISYWDAIDGGKLESHIKQAYEMPGGKGLYWEQVPLKVFKDQYNVTIQECQSDDIIEIDTFEELKAVDNTYDV